jgi:SAM-dependent methyltransferase
MRKPESWKPTKLEIIARPAARGPAAPDTAPDTAADAAPDDGPAIRVPGDPSSLGAGSTLIATLAGLWYSRMLARHARGVMLELGAGAMPYHALYRERTTQVWCIDWPQSLHEQPHADLYADLNDGIPLCSAMADTVIAADVLEHIFHPAALLAEMHRVLRPGGAALVNMPFMYWVHEAPHDYFRYTQHAVERLARDAGFEPLAIDALGGAACVMADIAGKLVQGRGAAGAWLARTLQRAVLRLQAPLPRSASSPLLIAAVLRKPAAAGGTS